MKVKVTEIEIGNVVKGNLVSGFHTVAKIGTSAAELRNTSTSYSFFDVDGKEFFIGRVNAKATLQD